MVFLAADARREVTLCNHNYSHEGIYHPDRIMEEYDLLYMQKGIWNIWEEDTCYHLREHQVLLLEPGKHHYSLDKCSPEMRNVYVHFTILPGDGIPEKEKLCVNKQTDCSNNQKVYHLYEQIIEAFWSDNLPNRGYRTSVLLDQLLIELADIDRARYQSTDVLVSEIIHRFHCSPERFFSPQELADDYHVSLRTISGRFKKSTGQSIHQYQLQLKLNMAYDTLPLTPGRGLRDIAHSFGFYDEFQFSKLFKRQFGISPSERRNPEEI